MCVCLEGIISLSITKKRGNSLGQVANGMIAAGVRVAAEGHAVVGGVAVDAAASALEALRVHSRVRLLVAQTVVDASLLVGRTRDLCRVVPGRRRVGQRKRGGQGMVDKGKERTSRGGGAYEQNMFKVLFIFLRS